MPWLVPLGMIVVVVLVVVWSPIIGLLATLLGIALPLGYAYVRNQHRNSSSW